MSKAIILEEAILCVQLLRPRRLVCKLLAGHVA